MNIVPYEPDTHFDAVHRIWQEVGWVEQGNDRHTEAMRDFVAASVGSVALVAGEAEAFGHWTPGTMWYVDHAIPMCAVTAITTSRVARRQGLARALTVRTLRQGREAGHAVAALGIFDQGYYDRLGFGTGSYEHRFSFDPASLVVDVPYRPPLRLSPDDWQDVHQAMLHRHRAHGTITLDPPEVIKSEMRWLENPIGLGYRDDSGRLTHFVMGSAKGESGPYTLQWFGYETPQQLHELLRLIKELSDQVASVVVWEPPGVQMQDFIDRPFRQRTRTLKSDHETSHRAAAFWQLRILDVEACLAARRWVGPEVRFNLTLRDPLEHIDPDTAIGGDYVVAIGASSGVERGSADGIPTLDATVNSFSRLWAGVRRASSLTVSDDLSGPPDLLDALDEAFALPEPRHGWFF